MRWLIVTAVLAFCFLPSTAILFWATALAMDWPDIWRRFQSRVLGRSDIWFGGSRYMRRWRLGPFRVHCIERSDADHELHDHPFSFVSFILTGGYWEHTPDGERKWHGPGSVVFRSAEALHRLELAHDCGLSDCNATTGPFPKKKKAWTFVVRGPVRRRWGFMTAAGWVPWFDFTADKTIETQGERPFAAPSSI